MGYGIIWSERSLIHLQEAVQHIAEDNSLAAEKFGEKIIERVSALRSFPRFGRVFRLLSRDDVRETPVPPYRIVYHVSDVSQTVTILAVWHGARQEPDISIP